MARSRFDRAFRSGDESMKRLSLLIILGISIALLLQAGCDDTSDHDGADGASDHMQESGHDHASESNDHGDDHGDEHGGEHGDEHGGEDGHGEGHADVVRLTPAQLERSGVRIEPLSGGQVTTHITLPAEVRLNQDALLHVTPRVPGIVSEVHVFLGDSVEAGDVLAVIDSPELGEAKIAYLQAVQAKSIADAELVRQRTISENTAKLLELLRAEPTPHELAEQAADLRIGENKGRLMTAYARVSASRANLRREQQLREKGLATEVDLLAAQESYNSSLADYFAALEEIDFTYRIQYQNAEQSAMIAASEADNAERRLHLLGLSEEQIAGIPNEPDSEVSRYVLTAASGGRVVMKHIPPGEMTGPDESVYTIADLSTVWLNISVYARYVKQINEGQRVIVHADGRTASGVVGYVSDIMDEQTRTIPARVVLDNTDRAWKPGSFATVRVETGQIHADRVVPIDAIQTFEGNTVVFVQDEDGIEPVPVQLGRQNDEVVEILGDDIPIGASVVVQNSFLMKAELGKGAAGHEH
ncbi:MAG TPA: HlyD family efflux transporter periplasmic adaptor subunit [Phycisphaerales bacterium]|nr:HlyD family efflux transporter periplasmic adaptor subunit [Phycisphaerales bacterium]